MSTILSMLDIVDGFRESGVPENEAKKHAEILMKATKELSTKQDLSELEQRVVDRITMKILKSQIALYVVLVTTMVGAIFALLKLFYPN
mgnify:CR=1 FL=1